MATFVLVPGAGGHAAYWDLVVPLLGARRHTAIAVDLPEDDPDLDLDDWAALVDDAIGDASDVVLVAQSLGGFLVPLLRRPIRTIVLLNAMIPSPDESPDEWWGNTGSETARTQAEQAAGRDPQFDVVRTFFHDVQPAARQLLMSGPVREPSARAMAQPCRFERWPTAPTRVVVGGDDRMFPADFQRRIAAERLGASVDVIPGGHLVALANPAGLVDLLLRYADEAAPQP